MKYYLISFFIGLISFAVLNSYVHPSKNRIIMARPATAEEAYNFGYAQGYRDGYNLRKKERP